ncbi:hypothetical protein FRB95_005967 [Tulasnella sp. JGI-2019a]|nr:hypothetical protein FRB93_010196 [Tulasnella sp. JGI-2019a]KAG9037328.1 hypothetical protein FRB95_005967 [Tulasnella sp. JGI-2019a]
MSNIQSLHELSLRLSLPILTAESCTSGMLASSVTSRPGASALFAGGVVAYSNLLKHHMLKVSVEILSEEKGGPGEVSEECAIAMARGVLQNSGILDSETVPKEVKVGMMGAKRHGLALSTTGFLQGGPEGRDGEVWVGCYWIYQGKEGSCAKKMDMKAPECAQRHAGKEDEAARHILKEIVVQEALRMAVEVANALETKDTKNA